MAADLGKEKFRRPVILAHRGAHQPETPDVRENTVAAFDAAPATGADGVELDVRRTRDGVLVVMHDRGPEDAEATDLPPWVPTLDAALAACTGIVNVEIKADLDHHPDLVPAVAAAVGHRPRILVSSFNLGALDAFHAAAPDIPTGWLTLPGDDQADAVRTSAERGHRTINPPIDAATPDLISAAHDAGLEVVVWTVNDPIRVPDGADVVVTDVPRRLIRARRGPGPR
jgi:glycerophosphoryl diester phosphodiesterase